MAEAARDTLLARLAPLGKIAVVRAARLGDVVCATPALRALRHAVPQAEITLIALPAMRELAMRLPYVDRFVPFPGFPGIAQQLFDARTLLDFLQAQQRERFDLAIQLHGSGVYANPFTLLLGARATVGFVRPEDDASLMAAALPWPTRGHETDRLLALMRYIGAAPRGAELAYPITPVDRRAADGLLAGLPRPIIGVHPGSHDPRRRWPSTRFIQVAATLLERAGASAVVLGTGAEAFDALALARAIGPRAHSLAGRTTLGSLGALIAALDLLVVNDTGPAHVAYALGTPTVAIYRSGGTERYGPPRDARFAALEPESGDTEALVTVAQVLAAAERLLAAARPGAKDVAACSTEVDLKASAE